MERDFEIVQCAVKYYVTAKTWDIHPELSYGTHKEGPFKSYADAEERANEMDMEEEYMHYVMEVVRELEEI